MVNKCFTSSFTIMHNGRFFKNIQFNCGIQRVKLMCKTISRECMTSAVRETVRHKTGCYQLSHITYHRHMDMHVSSLLCCCCVHFIIISEAFNQKIGIFKYFWWIVQSRTFVEVVSSFFITTGADVKILWSAVKQSSELCPEVSNIQHQARGKCFMTK